MSEPCVCGQPTEPGTHSGEVCVSPTYPDRRMGQVVSAVSERRPCNPPHVMDAINDELAERGWSLEELAVRMVCSRKRVGIELLALQMLDAVREPNVVLSQEQADDLGEALGVSPQFFLNMHEGWRRWAKDREEPTQ